MTRKKATGAKESKVQGKPMSTPKAPRLHKGSILTQAEHDLLWKKYDDGFQGMVDTLEADLPRPRQKVRMVSEKEVQQAREALVRVRDLEADLSHCQEARSKAEARVKNLEFLSTDLNSTVIHLRLVRDSLEADLAEAQVKMERPRRNRLPEERPALVHKFDLAGHHGFLTVGCYPDTGKIGELFVEMSREGGTVGGLLRSWGRAFSTALQFGAPIEDLVHKFAGTKFEPSGFSSHPEIGHAGSLVDYVIRWVSWRFEIDQEKGQQVGFGVNGWFRIDSGPVEAGALRAHEEKVERLRASTGQVFTADRVVEGVSNPIPMPSRYPSSNGKVITGPPCPECGNMTRRSGSCFACSCGATTGCS